MACNRCGECCTHMILSFNIDDDWPAEKEWLLAHVGVVVETEEDSEALVRLALPCRHLVPAENGEPASCLVHDDKPRVCLEYPEGENLQYLNDHPWVTPKCGYVDRR